MLKVKSIKTNNLQNVKVSVNGQAAPMTNGAYTAPSDPFKNSINSPESSDQDKKQYQQQLDVHRAQEEMDRRKNESRAVPKTYTELEKKQNDEAKSARESQRKEDSKWWDLKVTDSAKAVGLSEKSPVSQSLTKDKSLTWKNEETSEGWRLVARRDGKIAATVAQKIEGGKITGAETKTYVSGDAAEKEDAWIKQNQAAKADQRKEDSKWWDLKVTDSAKAVGLSEKSPVSQSLLKDKSLSWKNEETSEGWKLVARRDGKIAATVNQKIEGGKVTGADTKRFT